MKCSRLYKKRTSTNSKITCMHGTVVKAYDIPKITISDDISIPSTSASACRDVGTAIVGWLSSWLFYILYAIYDIMVRKPLRSFYFQAMYEGKNPEDICAQVSGLPAAFFTKTPENMAECDVKMEKLFRSWDCAAMFLVHFSLLTFITVRIILCLTCGRGHDGGRHHDRCNCGPCNHANSTDRVISVDDLKKLIESISTASAASAPSAVSSASAIQKSATIQEEKPKIQPNL